MTTERPEGRSETPGGRRSKGSRAAGQHDEPDLRWELRGRLHAVLQELEPQVVDWDVVETILRGAVEAIEAAS